MLALTVRARVDLLDPAVSQGFNRNRLCSLHRPTFDLAVLVIEAKSICDGQRQRCTLYPTNLDPLKMASRTPNTDGIGADGLSVLALSLMWDIPDAIVYDSAAITWRVDRWESTTNGVRSPHFLCNGVKWRLLCYPQGSPASSTPGGVSLYLDRGNFGQTTDLPSLCVQFAMIISNPWEPSNFIHQAEARRINSGEVLCGFDRFCSLREVQQRTTGNAAPVLCGGEADITVFLRIMYDPHDTLWLLGIPTRPLPTSAASEPTTSSAPSSQNAIAGPSSSNLDATPPEDPVPDKPLPPCRAAYPGEECIICADEPLLFPVKPPTPVCQHEGGICLPCLQSHISTEISGKGGVDGVVCPAPNCSEVMDYHEIKFWSDNSTFARYDRILMRRALGVEEDFVLCTRPGCDAGQIHSEGVSAPIVTCYVCHHRTCFMHQIPWHDGYTCDEWDQREKTRIGSATTTEYLTKFTKACPQCKKPIEKYDGCDSMLCKLPGGCGHKFCWLCLAPYDDILRDGNHLHRPSCRHYAPYNEPGSTRALDLSGLIHDLPPVEDIDSVASSRSSVVLPYVVDSTSPNAQQQSSLGSQSVAGPSSLPPYSPGASSVTSNTGKSSKKWYTFWKS